MADNGNRDPFTSISSIHDAALDVIAVDDIHNPRWPHINKDLSLDVFYEERFLPDEEIFPPVHNINELAVCKLEDAMAFENRIRRQSLDASSISTSVVNSELSGTSALSNFIKTPVLNSGPDIELRKKRVQKPPTTAGITLDNLKAVFGLERPEAEKRLGLKRTTFSNLSRYYGISKWPFRTIRDATNRKKANERMLRDANLSNEKRKKLLRQQVHLQGVINLMYSEPSQSKDSNTLAVLMNIVSSRQNQRGLGMFQDMKSRS